MTSTMEMEWLVVVARDCDLYTFGLRIAYSVVWSIKGNNYPLKYKFDNFDLKRYFTSCTRPAT